MRKGIKILGSFFAIVVLSLIAIPLFVSLLLYFPPVQYFAVKQAADFLSRKLETSVTVDRVSLKIFTRVQLDGLYVQDYQEDTLLYVPKLTVGVSHLGLFRGDFALGAVELDTPTFNLMQDSTGRSNLRQILDKIKRNQPGGKSFQLRAASLEIHDMAFRHRKFEVVPRPAGVNFSDLDISHFHLKARDISILDDSVALSIGQIALQEKSGFAINNLSAEKFSISGTGLRFEGLQITMPDSQLAFDHLRFEMDDWSGYKEFLRDVRLDASLRQSRVAFRTIGYFAPTLLRRQTVFEDVTLDVQGPVADMAGRIDRLRAGDTELKMRFAVRGIPDIPKTHFTFDVGRLQTHMKDISSLMKDFSEKSFGAEREKTGAKLGNIDLTGHFNGTFSDFSARATVQSALGAAGLNLDFSPAAGKQTAFRGNVQVVQFNLGRLLDAKNLGNTTLQANVDGAFSKGSIAMKANAEVPLLAFNGYNYHAIAMNGRFENRMFSGHIHSDDPNVRFDFDGRLDFNDSLPRYDFDMKLYHADLVKLHFNRRDSISTVQGNLTARASGSQLDNINGTAEIRDLFYVNADTVRTGTIRLTGRNSADSKYLGFASSFADIEFRGRHSYSLILDYLRNTMRYYLPGLSQGDRIRELKPASSAATDASNYYLVKLNVKEANNLAGIFLPGLELAEGTQLSLMFNPNAEHFSLTLNSEFIEYNKFFVSHLQVNSRNQADSLELFIRSNDLYAGGFHLPNLSVIGGAKKNRVNLATRFSDPQHGTAALVGVATQFERDPLSGILRLRLRLTPSNFTNGDRVWPILANEIVIDSTRIVIDRFRILSRGQGLLVNGVASRDRRDTLHVTLSNFDLAPLTQFTGRQGYAVQGITNGHADMLSALSGGRLEAKIRFDSVCINQVRLPSAQFDSRWDFATERARFSLIDLERRDTVIRGFYRPVEQRYIANADLRNVDLSLLGPLTEGILRDVTGHADAHLTLTGERKAARMNGTIRVPKFAATVDYLNVPYSLLNGEIVVKDNVMTLGNAPLVDPYGNKADFDLMLDLNHLKNFSYDVRVRPKDMLALNTTEQENNLFNGKVFASGSVRVRGDKRGASINVTATTSGNSFFAMSLDGASSIATTDFIRFESEKDKKQETLSPLEQRKLRFQKNGRQKVAGEGAMNLTFSLNVKPNTDFHLMIDPSMGDGIRARGNGTLNLRVNPKNDEFAMYGDYELTDGSYNFVLGNFILGDFIDRTFSIQPGSMLRWTGDPANPLLNITGVYKLKASLAPLLSGNDLNLRRTVPVEVDIKLEDRLIRPEITFDVRVPSADAEIQSLVANVINTQEAKFTQSIWLLAGKTFYADNTGRNIGAQAGSAAGLGVLANRFSNWVSSDRYNIDVNYRPRTDLTSDEVELGFSTELFNNRLQLEMEGNYDFGNNAAMNATRPAGTSNLTGNFYLTWLIDPDGVLRLKAFTRTIERFDENQGLQESGVGIYYKEDFNTFGDLLRNIRQRFRRKTEKTD